MARQETDLFFPYLFFEILPAEDRQKSLAAHGDAFPKESEAILHSGMLLLRPVFQVAGLLCHVENRIGRRVEPQACREGEAPIGVAPEGAPQIHGRFQKVIPGAY